MSLVGGANNQSMMLLSNNCNKNQVVGAKKKGQWLGMMLIYDGAFE